MKKKLPLVLIHRLFTAGALLVFAGFLAFLGYVYLAFSGPLIGDIKADASMDPLSALDEAGIQTALARMRTRHDLPDVPPDLPDPYRLERSEPAGGAGSAPAPQP